MPQLPRNTLDTAYLNLPGYRDAYMRMRPDPDVSAFWEEQRRRSARQPSGAKRRSVLPRGGLVAGTGAQSAQYSPLGNPFGSQTQTESYMERLAALAQPGPEDAFTQVFARNPGFAQQHGDFLRALLSGLL